MFDDASIKTKAEGMTPRQKADLLKRVIELLAPDLQSFYPTTVKGRIERVYTTDSKYFYCDVQPLNNDESVCEEKMIIKHVEMPILYAGPDRGIVCQPIEGLLCDISYYGGDESYPSISNLRYTNNKVPAGVHPGELLIQKGPGNYIKFRNDGTRENIIPGNEEKRVDRNVNELIGGNHQLKVANSQTQEIKGDKQITCKGALSVETAEATNLSSASFDIEATEKIELTAGGKFSAGGATTNLVSEDSFTMLSTGSMSQVASGTLSINVPNIKKKVTNLSTSPVVDSYNMEILSGNHKTAIKAGDFDMDITIGNFEVDITSGLFNLSNSADNLRAILETLYTMIDTTCVKLDEVIQNILKLYVGTGVGPSSSPLNSADFIKNQADINQFKSDLLMNKKALK